MFIPFYPIPFYSTLLYDIVICYIMLYYPFMLVFLGSHLPGPEIDGRGDAPGAEGAETLGPI